MFVPSYYHILVIVSHNCFASQHQGPTSLPCPDLQYPALVLCYLAQSTLARHSVSYQVLCCEGVFLCCSSTHVGNREQHKLFIQFPNSNNINLVSIVVTRLFHLEGKFSLYFKIIIKYLISSNTIFFEGVYIQNAEESVYQ